MPIKYLFSFGKCVFGAIPYLQSGYMCFVSESLDLIIFSGYLKFCMHMCWMCAQVHMYLDAGLCAYFRRPEVDTGCLLILFHFISQDRVSHVNPELANLGKLASLLQGCPVSAGYVLSCDYTWATTGA